MVDRNQLYADLYEARVAYAQGDLYETFVIYLLKMFAEKEELRVILELWLKGTKEKAEESIEDAPTDGPLTHGDLRAIENAAIKHAYNNFIEVMGLDNERGSER